MAHTTHRKAPDGIRHYGVRIFGGIEEAETSRAMGSPQAVARWFRGLAAKGCFHLDRDLALLVSVRAGRLVRLQVLPRSTFSAESTEAA